MKNFDWSGFWCFSGGGIIVFLIMIWQQYQQQEIQGPDLNFVSGQAPWSIQTAEGCYYWRDKDGDFIRYWLLNDGETAKCNGAKNK